MSCQYQELTPTPKNERVDYTYDAAGDLLTLQDHRDMTTTWTYDTEGRMRTKRYQGQTFANLEYTYNPNAQVATRKFFSAAGVSRNTTNTYDNAGNLTLVDYPTGTQDITIGYDALDRVSSMTDASGTTGYTYRDLGVLATENGPWANDTVTYTYNTAGLRSQLQLQQPTGNWTQNYIYDASRRLSTMTSPALSANPFVYAYSGNGRRVSQITFPTNARIGKDYDTLGRLTATYLKGQNGLDLNRDAYPVYNDRHQIIRHTRTDTTYVNFGYDNLGQLTSAVGNGGQSTENLGYAYDGGWNMTTRTSGGTPVNYTINDRNQVTSGPVGNNNYDANGNRTSQTYDASGPKTYNYAYDDENQLTSAATDTYYTPAGSRWKTAFTYDGRGRLRVRKQYTWTGGTPLVSGVGSLGTLRNNWAGYVGFQFTVGTMPLTVTELGRWVVSGNSGNHVVKLFNADGTAIPNGSVTVTTAGKPAGQFTYAALGGAVTLAAGTTYAVMSQEVNAGDYWYDYGNTTITLNGDASGAWAVYAYNNPPPLYGAVGGSGRSYGPVNLKCAWGPASETRYVYDGMLVIQERSSANTPTVTYTRGLDLSATLQGAGGIGGLLARSHGYSAGAWSSHNFYQADAGGNITAMANNHATSASLVANYWYDPFGRIYNQSGTLASANVYRFSSKEQMPNSGLYYYGFRFYDPLTQRWLNRDPLGDIASTPAITAATAPALKQMVSGIGRLAVLGMLGVLSTGICMERWAMIR